MTITTGLERDMRAKCFDRTTSGMTNGQRMSMKHKPWLGSGIAVKWIAKYWVADLFQVDPQLMGSASVWRKFETGRNIIA